ncbi:MAG: adenine nucleotide alpha hydrolase family protein [Nitrospirae bacterium]|nr:adenine nucleotide alpha hydrolase family protein [Nitrospirota bacterium]
MPQHRLALCRACYPPWFEKQTQRTIERFHMFGKTDRILVAVSGGKDSLGLWHALLQLGYVADGLYIHLRIQGSDGLAYSQRSLEFARAYADRSGRELIVVDLQETMGFGIPEIQRAVHRPACSPCGTTKRHYMNKVAVERGYDGLATGHNLDDEAATLFSNTLRWDMDYLARQTPVLPAAEGFARKVKPFCFFSEKETALYAVLEGVPYIREECPFALGATSLEHKDVINRLEHESPGTKRAFLANFLSAKDRLPAPAPPAMKPCRECGSPSPVEVCAFCRLRAATLARGSGLALTQVGARSVEGQGAVVCQVKT